MKNQSTQNTIVGRFGGNSGTTGNNDESNGNLLRTRCESYTRVMGYYRPVSFFNNGKKSEYYSRTYFSEGKSLNSEFCKEFE